MRTVSAIWRSKTSLENPKWMYLKAALLAVIVLVSAALLWVEIPTWRTAGLIVLLAWSCARLYYFMFYVIERYIDPTYRFSGVASALWYMLRRGDVSVRPRERKR